MATIATRVGGIPEVVEHGVTGLLVPPADPAALGEAIATLLADDVLRARMGQAGRVRAGHLFSLETVVAETLGHYRRLLDPAMEFDRMTAPAAAKTAEDAAAALARDGIVVLPDLLSADSLASLCQSFERALARPSFNTWIGYEQNEKWRRLVENLPMLDPAAFTLALHPLVTGAIGRHVGPGFALTEARGWKTIATKRNFHGWHSDAWSHASIANPPREVKLGVYLTDVTSGHFSYIAGSHAPWHRPCHWSKAEVAQMQSRRVDVLGPAGTAFLFDTAGVHRQSTPVLTPRNVLFFNYHDPSVRLQDEDVRAGRYRPLALNAGFVPDLTPEACRVLGFGRARDRSATEAVVGRATMRRYAGLHDAVAVAARLEWQEVQRIARQGRAFITRRVRRLLPAGPQRRVPAGE